MATFDIPESVSYSYMDLNNLQGMDSWDTNPSPMRASDMLNIVKKEGLHQVRHNVNQSYITGYRRLKNMYNSSYFDYSETTKEGTLYMDASLEPSTTYTISLISEYAQTLKVNSDLFIEDTTVTLVPNTRTPITLTTKATLPQKGTYGYEMFFTDETTSVTRTLANRTSYTAGSVIIFDIENMSETTFDNNFSNDYTYSEKTTTSNLVNTTGHSVVGIRNYYKYATKPYKQEIYTTNELGENVLARRTIPNFERTAKNPLNTNTTSMNHGFNLSSSGTEICRVTININTSGIRVPSDNSGVTTNITPSIMFRNTMGGSHTFTYGCKITDTLKTVETGATESTTYTFTNVSGSIDSATSELTTNFATYNYNLVNLDNADDLADYTYERTLNYEFTVSVDNQYNYTLGYETYPQYFTFNYPVFPPTQDHSDEYLMDEVRLTDNLFVLNFTNYIQNYITFEENNYNNSFNRIQIEEGSEMTDYTQPITSDEDDLTYVIKYIGKIEEYDDNGNPVPYYIKISEYLGQQNVENDSELIISVWPTPLVKNIQHDLSQEQGFEIYKISYKKFPFTNYGISGNRQGLYEHVEFDGKERVFTPIGILSFNCSTTDTEDGYRQLNFEVENVLDNPYVPTIGFGSTPEGLDYTTYEPINLLTDKRKFQFLSDGTSTQYHLPEKNLEENITIQILQDNGTFTNMEDGFTLDKATGVITFTTAPGESPIDGRDNVIVEYEKKPTSAIEANEFTITTTSNDNLLKADVSVSKSADLNDTTKIDATLTIKVYGGSAYNSNDYDINGVTLKVMAGSIELFNRALTTTELSTLNTSSSVTISEDVTFNNDGAIASRIWSSDISVDYTKDTYKQTTTTVSGSKGSDTNFSTVRQACLGFSWIGLEYSGRAVATVGSKTDGSDSYWDVYVWVRLWISRADYLNTVASSLYGVVDGERVYAGSTGAMRGTSTVYPSSGLTIKKRIPFNSTKRSVSIGAYLAFGATTNLSGTNYNSMSAGNTTLNLPSITLPKTVTTTSGEKTTGTTSGSVSFNESISNGTNVSVKYENVVPGSARLACYYGARCVTVYGYESDRRVFVTDGTNCDTFSGSTLDGSSSITYFPDTNYRVLGEDTEIIGYAQKDGYLFTFKRGEDSVYVRYATTLDDETEFPSAAVTRNLQVLARPIQVDNEILLITREGIKGMSYVSQECRTELRSYFISNYFKLSADYDYDKMQWFKDDALLHIFLNNYEFTADLVSKSYVQEGSSVTASRYSTTLSFQYEWYVSQIDWLDNTPPYVVVYQPKDFERQTEGIVYEYQREIGYNNKGVFEFSYNDSKVDRIMRIVNDDVITKYKPIKAHYITPFLNMGAINVAKTVKYVYINTRSNNNDMFAIGYIDENGYQETLQKLYTNITDYRTKLKNSEVPFPKLIQIKSKIRKFMNIKLYVQNRAELENINEIEAEDESLYGNTTFDRILIQYQVAGKYRGE